MWLISHFVELDRLRRENRQGEPRCREESIPGYHETKPVLDIGPGKEGGALEGFAGSRSSQAGLELAENRLKGAGFTKREDGNRVSYRRELIGYHLYADPRPDTRIDIYVELCHWCAIGCAPLFFLWNPWWADVIMVTYALAANLPCILAQRYNRLRFQRLLVRLA